jgi:hypothetical protein
MSWDKLIISQKSSKLVKEQINQFNLNDNFEGKYIGIIPIYWDSLNIHNNNKQTFENLFENLTIDNSIHNIYTSKDKIIILRELYYLMDKNINYYQVIRYSDNLTFSIRELKKFIGSWLKLNGFTVLDNDEFELFRIYKMNGFHLFCVILPSKSNITNIHKINTTCEIEWKSNYNMELLPLINQEIINPFMKVSQYKYNITNTTDIWNQYMEGYFDKNKIIPFKIKWAEILATMSNLIDSNPNENIHLYFKCNIVNEYQNNGINLFKNYIKKANNIEDDMINKKQKLDVN